MKKFKIENRYLVLKLTDIEKALSDKEKEQLEDLSMLIESLRVCQERKSLECVVVESDWSIYDHVLRLIEKESKGPLTPLPIGKIKNKYLRRIAMIFSFPVYVCYFVLFHSVMMTIFYIRNVIYSIFVLSKSLVERWNEPRK